MNNKDKQMDDVVERALYAFLKEDSAQMGEPFPLDWWESYKTKNPTEYAEYYASMKCALEAIGYQALVESEAKAQAEAKRLRELLEWQPIETAPSNKTVLVFFQNELGKGRVVKAVFFPKNTNTDTDGEFAEYDEETDEYYAPEGWYEDVHSDTGLDYSYIFLHEEPTHWKHLDTPEQINKELGL